MAGADPGDPRALTFATVERARGGSAGKEMAVRLAIGAGRRKRGAETLVESSML